MSYEGVVWYLARGAYINNGYITGPLWYRIHEGRVQRNDNVVGGWLTSSTYGDDCAGFLRNNLPIVPALGYVYDADLAMDEGL